MPGTKPVKKAQKEKLFYGHIIVAAGIILAMTLYGAAYSFGVFFKPVLNEFGWTRAATSGAYSLNMLLFGLSGVAAGRLTDRLGPRIVVTVCGIFGGVGFLLMAKISALWQLYLFYGLLFGTGMGAWVSLLTIVARWFDRKRGLMTGILSSGVAVGVVIVPPAANNLIAAYGWRDSYLIIGSLVLVISVVAAQFLRRDPGQVKAAAGGSGGASREEVQQLQGFSFNEASRTRQFIIVCVMFFCFNVVVQVLMVHLVPHATDLGIAPASAAGILSFVGGLKFFGTIGGGSAADRMGNKRPLLIIFLMALAALLFLQIAVELWMFYLFAVVWGICYGVFAALMSPLVAELFGLKAHGTILGVTILFATIGGAVGPLLGGYIFDMTGSYQIAFMVSAALVLVSFILTVPLRPVPGAAVSVRGTPGVHPKA